MLRKLASHLLMD